MYLATLGFPAFVSVRMVSVNGVWLLSSVLQIGLDYVLDFPFTLVGTEITHPVILGIAFSFHQCADFDDGSALPAVVINADGLVNDLVAVLGIDCHIGLLLF